MKRRGRRTSAKSNDGNSSHDSKVDELEMDPIKISASSTPQPSPIIKAPQQLKQKRRSILRKDGKKKRPGKKILKVKFRLPAKIRKIKIRTVENDIEDVSQMDEIGNNSYGNDIEESLNEIENHSFINEDDDIDDVIEEQDIQTSLINGLAHTIRHQNYSIIDNLPFALSRQKFKRSSIIDDITYRIERSEIQSKYLEKCFFADKSKIDMKRKKETSNKDCGVKQKSNFVTSAIDCAVESSELQESSDGWTIQTSAGHGSFIAMSVSFALDRNRALQNLFDNDMEHLFKIASGESERTWKLH